VIIAPIGHADDAILTALVLHRLLREEGPTKLTEHWPGPPEGLTTLRQMLHVERSRAPAPAFNVNDQVSYWRLAAGVVEFHCRAPGIEGSLKLVDAGRPRGESAISPT
jgi:hypothetical protein